MKNNKYKSTLLAALMAGISGGVMASEMDWPVGAHVDAEGNATQAKSLVDGEVGVGATSIRYQSFAGSGMTTLRTTNPYVYSGGGCVTSLGTYSGFDQNLDLPHGSRLVSVSYLVNDQDAAGTTRGLLFSGNETFSDFADFATTAPDVTGFTNIGGFIDFTISDNEDFITARLEISNGTNSEVCGVRVGFIPPSHASDVYFASNFQR